MSFVKGTDPEKGVFKANEFLMTRQNIQQNFLSECVGDLNTQYELLKLFKPVTDMQKVLKEGLLSEIKPIREGMQILSKAITFPQFLPKLTMVKKKSVHLQVKLPNNTAKICFTVWR